MPTGFPKTPRIDIWYVLVFGVIGYVLKKLDYPIAPLVLALVLGNMMENAPGLLSAGENG